MRRQGLVDLRVERHPTHGDATIGRLTLDGEPICWTLEDAVREVPGQPVSSWKIAGVTAIPTGKYSLTVEYSPRFGEDTLTIANVPGFSGIRIHAGNQAKDTEGCLLVGRFVSADGLSIRDSRLALAELRNRVVGRLKDGEPATITIGRAG